MPVNLQKLGPKTNPNEVLCGRCWRSPFDSRGCAVTIVRSSEHPECSWRRVRLHDLPVPCGECGAPSHTPHHLACSADGCPVCETGADTCRCDRMIFPVDIVDPEPKAIHFLERTTAERLTVAITGSRVVLERKRRSATSLDDGDFSLEFRIALTPAETRELRSALALALGQLGE